MSIKNWLKAVRYQYLPASVIPAFTGIALAYRAGHFNAFYALLTVFGVALAHMSADLFNDYYDYVKGTDLLSKNRGLSGGSGVLVEGLLSPKEVKRAGYLLLGFAAVVGLYLTLLRGLPVLLLTLLGGVSIYLYTSVLQRVGLGELTLALERVATVAGSFYVQALFVTSATIFSGLSLGVLSIYMVYYAAFPDYDADKATGKKTLVVLLGKERALKITPLFPLVSYFFVFLGVLLNALPLYALFTLCVLPLAILSVLSAKKGQVSQGLRQTAIFTRVFGVVLTLSVL